MVQFFKKKPFFTDLCCLGFMNMVEKPVSPLPPPALCYWNFLKTKTMKIEVGWPSLIFVNIFFSERIEKLIWKLASACWWVFPRIFLDTRLVCLCKCVHVYMCEYVLFPKCLTVKSPLKRKYRSITTSLAALVARFRIQLFFF